MTQDTEYEVLRGQFRDIRPGAAAVVLDPALSKRRLIDTTRWSSTTNFQDYQISYHNFMPYIAAHETLASIVEEDFTTFLEDEKAISQEEYARLVEYSTFLIVSDIEGTNLIFRDPCPHSTDEYHLEVFKTYSAYKKDMMSMPIVDRCLPSSLMPIYRNTNADEAVLDFVKSPYIKLDASATEVLGPYYDKKSFDFFARRVRAVIDANNERIRQAKLGIVRQKEKLRALSHGKSRGKK